MNLAQSTILNAINYSVSKNGYANIILAGPIGVGKREIAQLIAKRLNLINFQNTVSIFLEEGYYIKPSTNDGTFLGVIDSKETFDVEKYLCDVKKFLNAEFVYARVEMRDNKGKRKVESIYSMQPKGNICIYTGPHAIELLQNSDANILNPVYIFLNGDLNKCIQKRLEKCLLLPNYYPENLNEYTKFIVSQNEKYILPQKEKANIILNLD